MTDSARKQPVQPGSDRRAMPNMKPKATPAACPGQTPRSRVTPKTPRSSGATPNRRPAVGIPTRRPLNSSRNPGQAAVPSKSYAKFQKASLLKRLNLRAIIGFVLFAFGVLLLIFLLTAEKNLKQPSSLAGAAHTVESQPSDVESISRILSNMVSNLKPQAQATNAPVLTVKFVSPSATRSATSHNNAVITIAPSATPTANPWLRDTPNVPDKYKYERP